MPKDQWERFLAHIQQHGVRDPILITKESVIVDGLSRHHAARESGHETIPAVVVDWDEAHQEVHMLEAALRRRHLSDSQRAMAEAKLRQLAAPQMREERARKAGQSGGRGRGKKSDSSTSSVCSKVSTGGADVASNAEITPRTNTSISVRKRRDADAIAKKSPEMADRVLAGDLSMNDAKRQLREQGKLPPAKPPRPDKKTEETATGETPPSTPASMPSQQPPTTRLPIEPGAVLAQALVREIGVEKALQLLREAIATVEEQRDRAGEQPIDGTEPAMTHMNDGNETASDRDVEGAAVAAT
jgi:hypothetical protein